MKKVLYFVSLLALVVAVSCNEKESPITQDNPGTVTFEMQVKIPETVVSTRANCASDPLIDHIYVATFGSNQFLNEYVKAIPVGSYATENETIYQMKVTLLATSSKRHVHVIANGPTSLDYMTKDTDLMLKMSTTYNSSDVPQGAYWQYFYLANGTAVLNNSGEWTASPSALNAFSNIVLVRNFARITVTNLATDDFVLEGFHVFRTENEGSIAMPTSNACGQDFVNTVAYTSVPDDVSPVTYIKSLPYSGYTPEGVTLHDEAAITGVTWNSPGAYQFVYESIKTPSSHNEPFIILQGHLTTETGTKYYKMELIDADGKDFPILRNLDYTVTIESVAESILGASDPSLAQTCNGSISTSVSSDLSQLSDGYSALAVLYTDKTFVNTDATSKPVTFMYMYDPAIEDGSSVTIETVRSEGAGHAIEGATGTGWYTTSAGSGKWTNVTFNVLPSSTYSGSEAITVFKVTGKSKVTADGNPQSLFRYVTVHLLPMQSFISPQVEADGVGKDDDVTITFTLPDNLPISLFPLEITVKDTKNSLNPKGTDMPLVLDGNGVYHFVKYVSWDEYKKSKNVTCEMLFLEAVSSPVITLDNEYFNAVTATVTGEGTFNFQ